MVLAAAGDAEESLRVPPKAGHWYSHTRAGKPSSLFPPFSQGGWQPSGMLAKVAVVLLMLVAWDTCFQAERGPKGISQEARCLAHLCTCLSACVCASSQGWYVCLGMEEKRRSGRCWLYFQKFLEKRNGLLRASLGNVVPSTW